MKTRTVALVLCAASLPWTSMGAVAQEVEPTETYRAPPYQLLRAEEQYTYLRDGSPYGRDLFDPVKFIPLNASPSVYFTLGGEIRPRFEYFDNEDWEEAQEGFYSQRLAFHSVLNLGAYVRLFGEVYHGLLSKEERAFAEDDDLDLHQGFLEVNVPIAEARRVQLRAGRQELAYGSARLVGLREGPNIRRSFDALRAKYQASSYSIEGFWGSEVVAHFEAFDNKRNDAMLFWGVYGQFDTSQLRGATQIYYFGFAIDQALYNDGLARETRHTLGIRRFGSLGEAFRFNTEWIIQLGTFGEKDVRAFAIETDYHYRFHSVRWRPEIGLRLDYISGDKTHGDDKLGTFNPLFTNPSYFGLLAQITPINLIDIHPSVKLELTENTELVVDWDFFWRAQKGDGLYSPPRFLSRKGHEAEARFLGHQPGFELVYGFNRHVTLRTEVSYFITGTFIEETGEAEDIFHFATTVSYKF